MIIIISNSPFIVTVSLVSCFVFYSYMVRVCDYGFFSVAFMFAFLRIPWRMTAFLCTRMTQLRMFHCARTPQLLHYCSTIMCVLNFQEELAVWWIDQPKSKSLTHALSVLYSHVTLETTPYFSPLANSLEPGSSAPKKKNDMPHSIKSAVVQARAFKPTCLSMTVGWQRRPQAKTTQGTPATMYQVLALGCFPADL